MSVEVSDHTALVISALGEAFTSALNEMGEVAVRHAKEYVPVDTGRLRDSIGHHMEGDRAVVVSTNVEYAPIVELGSSKQRAQPYLRPTLNNHVGEYRDILVNHVKAIGD